MHLNRRRKHLLTEEHIALACPYCRAEIYRPLNWFKQAYLTCPACDGGLTADQFAPLVRELEQALDETIEEMVQTKSGCGCGGGCCDKASD